jgi:hypothetical protein
MSDGSDAFGLKLHTEPNPGVMAHAVNQMKIADGRIS